MTLIYIPVLNLGCCRIANQGEKGKTEVQKEDQTWGGRSSKQEVVNAFEVLMNVPVKTVPKILS